MVEGLPGGVRPDCNPALIIRQDQRGGPRTLPSSGPNWARLAVFDQGRRHVYELANLVGPLFGGLRSDRPSEAVGHKND
jgi:hypothetical protein